eukprot:3580562-Rhodomonas_salina.1
MSASASQSVLGSQNAVLCSIMVLCHDDQSKLYAKGAAALTNGNLHTPFPHAVSGNSSRT